MDYTNLQTPSILSSERHLDNLNPPQKEAVEHGQGPILVLAGAGTGKTRVLTRRIAHLIIKHQVRPFSIFAVTFTNKAAGEMKERLKLLIGSLADNVWASTFHSSGVRILRRHADRLGLRNDFSIYDASDTKDLLKKILKEKKIDDKRYPVNIFSGFIDSQKHIPLYPEDFTKKNSNTKEELQLDVYHTYQQRLRAANAVDFGDLLALTHKLFKEHQDVLEGYQNQFEYILVDEFQDTNKVQYDIVKMLTGKKRNLLVVGDDDQSIYAFRGATIQNILTFEQDFKETKVVKLEQNYRSTSNILEGAHAVISKNTGRKDKKVWTAEGQGSLIEFFAGANDTEEAQFIAKEIRKHKDQGASLRDVAIFYRTNAQSRAIEEALIKFRLPYRVFGGLKFYDRKEIKDIIAYIRLVANSGDDQAFLRIINTPTRGIGAQTIVQISDSAKEESCSLLEAARTHAGRNKSVASFISLIDQLIEISGKSILPEFIAKIIDLTGYAKKLSSLKDDPQAESRLENLTELTNVALLVYQELDEEHRKSAVQFFLDRVALTGGDDTNPEDKNSAGSKINNDTVSLMTLHLAKGLEFDTVFLTGLEEGLLPHQRTIYQPDEIEEERRLCYVGMTRARKSLFLTRAKKRGMYSSAASNITEGANASWFKEPSRFCFDIPKEVYNDPMGSFFTSFEDTFWDEDSDVSSFGTKKTKPKNNITSFDLYNSGIIQSGDAFDNSINNKESRPKIDHLPPLQVSDIQEEVTVTHPSFGKGTIKGIDGDISDKSQAFKVLVHFTKLNDTKKLVFRYAGLRLGS